MTNKSSAKRTLGFPGDARVPFFWAGWNDALAGLPMDYHLMDRAPHAACASAYEQARLRVLALRCAHLPVPAWKSMRSVPPAIRAAMSLTNSLNAMARAKGAPYWPVGPDHWRPAA